MAENERARLRELSALEAKLDARRHSPFADGMGDAVDSHWTLAGFLDSLDLSKTIASVRRATAAPNARARAPRAPLSAAERR